MLCFAQRGAECGGTEERQRIDVNLSPGEYVKEVSDFWPGEHDEQLLPSRMALLPGDGGRR